MAENSQRLGLPFLQAGQAQKELTHNEALVRLDHVTHLPVETAPGDTPPPMPAEATTWLIGGTPSGDWAGHAGEIALWTEGGWRFVASQDGMIAWIRDSTAFRVRRAGNWNALPWPVAAVEIGGDQVLGPRQPAIAAPEGGATKDTEARAAIVSILLTLRTHGLISAT